MREGAICDLKYFAGRANELHLLRERVAELEELLGMGEVSNWQIAALGFTRIEAAVLGTILNRKGVARKSFIYAAVYGSTLECDQPEEKIVDVWISKIRAKLRRLGIEIMTVRSHGWVMPDEHKVKLRDLLQTTEGTACK